MARISGAIVAIVMAVLLGLTIAAAMQPSNVVLPTGGVIDGGPNDSVPVGERAAAILADRARLQEWRGAPGPSPEQPDAPAITGSPIPRGEPSGEPRETVRNWTNSETEWQILREPEYLRGTTNLPTDFSEVLEQPQGRVWRRGHNEALTFGGGDIIFGVTLLLALFLAFRGRIRIAEGESGETVSRFSPFERANHWVTATSFIVMALTGLIIMYGQYLIKPWLGPGAYSTLAEASAYAHVAFAIPFVAGVVVMVALWIGQNGINRIDLHWLRRGGGFLSERQKNPPARRFNAGQKLIFWAVVLSAIVLLATGLALVFPLFWLGVVGMQWAQAIHAAMGLIMIAVIIGHIYIGTVGMQGAFQAMWSGRVDRNWAREHHSLWYDEIAEHDAREAPQARRSRSA